MISMVADVFGGSVLLNASKLEQALTKGFRFATSVALNRTGIDAQRFTVGSLLPSTFILRSQWYQPRKKYGFNLNFSNKENLQTRLYSNAPWLPIFETGGTLRPKGKAFAIPSRAGFPDRTKVVRPKPKDVEDARKFVNTVKGKPSLFYRKGKSKSVMSFFLRPFVRIPAIFPFSEKVGRYAEDNYPRQFDRAFEEVSTDTFKSL